MSWLTKESLLPLLQQYGYAVYGGDKDISDEMFALFVNNIESQLREALRVALVAADNDKRSELREADMGAVLKQCTMFPQQSINKKE